MSENVEIKNLTEKLEKCDFRDSSNHPLINCREFKELVARAAELEAQETILEGAIKELTFALAEFAQENLRLKEALKHYAEPSNWQDSCLFENNNKDFYVADGFANGFDLAREVLEKGEKDNFEKEFQNQCDELEQKANNIKDWV